MTCAGAAGAQGSEGAVEVLLAAPLVLDEHVHLPPWPCEGELHRAHDLLATPCALALAPRSARADPR